MHQPPKFVRYRDLTEADINVELHAHTTQTDGKASIAEMIQRAHERGLSALALTEHVRRDTPWFGEWAANVRTAAQAYADLTVYVGCEAKALDTEGGLDTSDEIRAESNMVVGVVHRFPDGQGGLMDWNTLTEGEFAQTEFALANGLLKTAPIHVLGHPGGMYQRKFKRPFPADLFAALIETSLERGIAFEISTSYLVDAPAFLDLCEQINPVVSIGSDVHQLDTMATCRDTLMALRRA